MKRMNLTLGKNILLEDHKVLIFNKINNLTAHLERVRLPDKKIGFVPTMGALHQGHISLVEKAKKENDLVVVSIFVNPSQFNNPDDLKNYPRTPVEDHLLLDKNKADIIFSPPVEEINNYSNTKKINSDLGNLANVMEGIHRPGHFDGVVQIVSRLFDIVKPGRAYFGEKDFQQLTIIKLMTDKLKYPVEIIACPTIREESGLAMSSRNLKLSEEGLKNAAEISMVLNYVKDNQWKFPVDVLIKLATQMIESSGKLKVEYLEIADEETLQRVQSWEQHKHVRCFAAVYCEDVRLIDNVSLF